MDLIEQLFNIAPDNGSGLSETAILVAVFAALAICFRAYRKRAPAAAHSSGSTGPHSRTARRLRQP